MESCYGQALGQAFYLYRCILSLEQPWEMGIPIHPDLTFEETEGLDGLKNSDFVWINKNFMYNGNYVRVSPEAKYFLWRL